MRDFRDAKLMARTLREGLAQQGVTLGHSAALELVARQFGLESWNHLAARLAGDEPRFTLTAPILRIFDVAKAQEFYLGFLGFRTDWEHRYGENFPLYTQISRGDLVLHLSEHAGDATPGATLCAYMTSIRAFQAALLAQDYRYMKPGLQMQEGRLECTVTDPFGNRIRFMELT